LEHHSKFRLKLAYDQAGHDKLVYQTEFYRAHPRLVNRGHYVNWQEITYVNTILTQLNLELQYLENLLPSTRTKRGLLDFEGQALKIFVWDRYTVSQPNSDPQWCQSSEVSHLPRRGDFLPPSLPLASGSPVVRARLPVVA
jgi:hypothetical protein